MDVSVATLLAKQTKHANIDHICADLGHQCVPIAVETFEPFGQKCSPALIYRSVLVNTL